MSELGSLWAYPDFVTHYQFLVNFSDILLFCEIYIEVFPLFNFFIMLRLLCFLKLIRTILLNL